MVCTSFQIKDKLKRAHFFQETFLVVNTSIKVIAEIFFLVLNNANVNFAKKELT